MRTDALLNALSRKVPARAVLLAAVLLLGGLEAGRRRLSGAAAAAAGDLAALQQAGDDLSDAQDDAQTLLDLKTKDLNAFKNGLARLTQSRRALYEAGLDLQEEKRELEKLWEILTTYLVVDEAAKKVSVMTGDQALVSYPFDYAPPRLFGGETEPVPPLVRVTSKERWANPERGKFEQVDGKLQWEPPQVGTSVRANALGEYVVFTDSPLILHGPPRNAKEHESFAHACLGLPLAVARRLYEKTFIGTKILLVPAPAAAAKAAAPPRGRAPTSLKRSQRLSER